MDENIPPTNGNNEDSGYNQQIPPASQSNRYNGPSLGSGKGKVIFAGVLLAGFVIFMLSSIFGGGNKNEASVNIHGGESGKAKSVAEAETTGAGEPSIALPPPPKAKLEAPPPSIVDTNLLPPPELPPVLDKTENQGETDTDLIPPPPPLPANESGSLFRGGKSDKDMQARIRSNMLIVDGGKESASESNRDSALGALTQSDQNRAFSDNVIRGTRAEKETATRLSNLGITIAQGKIINAVLETAINTELPGTLRAIVSRDTYAETGRTILIPKGSRLIGTYNTGILQGQKRVMIVWTRLIRPDGIDIMIGSPGIDGLGRAGVEGFVDNRYTEIFSSAILTTMLSLGAAYGSDRLLPDKSTTTTNSGGGTTTTNVSPAQQAAGDAVQNLTGISKNVVEGMINIRPTITIDQGTRINVFVNRDLTFPPELGEALFVQ